MPLASRGHHASRIRIASASAYFLEPAEVSVRLPPAVSQVWSLVTAAAAVESVTVELLITFSRSGRTSSARRSAREASAMAFTSEALVTPPAATSFLTRSSSRLPRCTEPSPQEAVA
ncbi:hypothetical protein SVIOM74S_06872 [Streptomyces violarus]